MTTTSTDEFHNAEYDYAVVKLETSEAKVLARYINVFNATKAMESDVVQITLTDTEVECEYYIRALFLMSMAKMRCQRELEKS